MQLDRRVHPLTTFLVAASMSPLASGRAQAAAPDQPSITGSVTQGAYVKASNTESLDQFGYSVAASGDTFVVAAPFEDSAATGVDGDQGDNSAFNAGAVYVFVREGESWTQQAYLKASNTGVGDCFGESIAICGDTLVVGAPAENSAAMGVNGDESDDSAFDAGAAYVFVRTGDQWNQEAYLKASNTAAQDFFGSSVSISDDTIVVGAPFEDSPATGVNGTQGDGAFGSGAAYVFQRTGSTWTQAAYLKASNTEVQDEFGTSVAIDGDTIAVAARREDSAATGVDGDEGDNSAPDSGAVYVFSRTGTEWSGSAYLKSSNTEALDEFGKRVSVAGNTIAISAWHEDSAASGINGDQLDNSKGKAGAVYVFADQGGQWSQEAYIKASNPDATDQFGVLLSLSDDTLVVSANWEDSAASGIDGDEDDNSLTNAGAAYLFERSAGEWTQRAYLKSIAPGTSDSFGVSPAIAQDFVVVGAYREDSNATGIDGDSGNNSFGDSGAAYVFELDSCPTTAAAVFRNDSGDQNPTGFTATPPQMGMTWVGEIDLAPTSSTSGIVFGYSSSLEAPTAYGWLLVDPQDPTGELLGLSIASGTGTLTFSLLVPNDPNLCGFTFSSQAASFGSTQGVLLHNAYDLTIGT